MNNRMISIHFILSIIILAMLPLQASAYEKNIQIKDIEVSTLYRTEVKLTVYEPHFKGDSVGRVLTFKTPTEMTKVITGGDKFTLYIELNENEIQYLSQFKSVDLMYPVEVIYPDYYNKKFRTDEDIAQLKAGYMNFLDDTEYSESRFYSKINVSELLRKIEESKSADKKNREESNKPVNKLKDFFGIDR